MISKEKIEDIIITALEGGSNYWYTLINESSTEEVLNKINAGENVMVFDQEDPDTLLGLLNQKSIQKGIQQSIYENSYLIANVIEDNWDANDADCLFQYFVMNEIVFG